MKRNKWKKHLAMLLCAASVLGQSSPALAYNSFWQRSIQAVQESVAKEKLNVTADSVSDGTVSDSDGTVSDSDGTVSGSNGTVSDSDLVLAGKNIALNKDVIVSAADATLPGSNVNDGDLQTRWGKETAAPHHVIINLGGEGEINGFKIAFELPSSLTGTASQATQKIGQFKIEGSDDGVTFEDLIFQSEDKTEEGYDAYFSVSLNDAVTSRYVKLTIEKLKKDYILSCGIYQYKINFALICLHSKSLALLLSSVRLPF